MITSSINRLKGQELTVVWLRRDLRLEDNAALSAALSENQNVLPLFIFDDDILEELPKNDARLNFIYGRLAAMQKDLENFGSSVLICKGKPLHVWQELVKQLSITRVNFNRDYEPYARERDKAVVGFLQLLGIPTRTFKDHVIFEQDDVMKDDGTPYTVFTPYKKKWLSQFQTQDEYKINFDHLVKVDIEFPSLAKLGLEESNIEVQPFTLVGVAEYADTRNFPALDATSYLSPHLRFGNIGVRQVIRLLKPEHETFLSELIWREFFQQVLYHFPHVVTSNFRSKYDGIQWRNNAKEFEKWCKGETGYPMVDAGMRQLNQTGYMHNRVRMVTASFLCKHLLIDWRWGEAYFAGKLLDYELASNNGNWQWAAGTGCDAAPYFRVFNPSEQLRKFDSDLRYVKKWVPEYGTSNYAPEMVDHRMARIRALETYKAGISN